MVGESVIANANDLRGRRRWRELLERAREEGSSWAGHGDAR